MRFLFFIFLFLCGGFGCTIEIVAPEDIGFTVDVEPCLLCFGKCTEDGPGCFDSDGVECLGCSVNCLGADAAPVCNEMKIECYNNSLPVWSICSVSQ